MFTGDAADRFLRLRNIEQKREAILERLDRVNASISAWNEYEANEHLPADLKRALPQPELSRQTLNDLHTVLLDELKLVEAMERAAKESGAKDREGRGN